MEQVKDKFVVPWAGTPSFEEVETFCRRVEAASHKLLHQLAYRIVRDHHAAEDVVQEALLAMLEQSLEGRLQGHIRSWLLVTTRNLAIKQRERGRIRTHEDVDAHVETLAQEEGLGAEELELCAILVGHIEMLPLEQQRALQLRVLEERSYPEIAALTGLSERTARRLCDEARIWLKSRVESLLSAENREEIDFMAIAQGIAPYVVMVIVGIMTK